VKASDRYILLMTNLNKKTYSIKLKMFLKIYKHNQTFLSTAPVGPIHRRLKSTGKGHINEDKAIHGRMLCRAVVPNLFVPTGTFESL
jgi:hypothetical protein